MRKMLFVLVHMAMFSAGCAMNIDEDVDSAGDVGASEDIGFADQELKMCDHCIPRDAPPEADLPVGTTCGRMGAGGWDCTAPNGDKYYCDNDWNCMQD